MTIGRHKKTPKMCEFRPTRISYWCAIKVKRCILRGHFQLVIRRHKKSQKISEFCPTGIGYWWTISRLKRSQKMYWPIEISRLKKSQGFDARQRKMQRSTLYYSTDIVALILFCPNSQHFWRLFFFQIRNKWGQLCVRPPKIADFHWISFT